MDDDRNDSGDEVNDTSQTRSYDCMYCKRGFSTAQALGGHMNIHRRDRARGRDDTPPSSHVGGGGQEKNLFPLGSSSYSGSSGKSGKSLDPEKVQELMKYGKDLALGYGGKGRSYN